MTGIDLARELSDRMTPTLADYISKHFTVVTQVETGQGGDSSFDATVWRANAADGKPDPNGKLTISMRGTQQFTDFLVDGDLAITGNARAQVTDMINWWLRISTPVGQQAQQVQAVGSLYTAAPAVAGEGLVTAYDLAQGTEVNGHSLGGYLACAFTRLFGFQASVQHTTTFNSAGFAPGSEPVFASLQGLIGPYLGLGHYPSAAEQTNVFGSHGLNVTTNSFYFSQQGRRAELFNEESTGFPNHYMYKLTDTLALGVALQRLDPSLKFGGLNGLLDAGSNVPAASIEGILDGLRKALAGPHPEPLPIGDADDSAPSRVVFHATLAALQDNPVFTSLEGQLTLRRANADLAATARHDFGALVALQDLSPIVIGGADAQMAEIWRVSRAADYAAWEADRYAPHPTTFTTEWFTDRAAMLSQVVQRNLLDAQGIVQGSQNIRYFDAASKTEVLVGAGSDQRQQFVFGGDGADTATGEGYADHLYGGAGADTLDGKGGADYLEGGAGLDTYQFNGDFGQDTVVDSDGLGSIQVDGKAITKTHSIPGLSNTWIAELEGGERVGLAVADDASSATGKKLVIARPGSTADTITVNHFDLAKARSEAGYLGIQLDGAAKLALREGAGPNPFEKPGFDPATLSGNVQIKEGAGKALVLYLNRPAQAGDTITLALSDLKDKFQVVVGDWTMPADGAVITLAQGQTQVLFALVQQGAEVDADGVAQISATYTGQALEPGGPALQASSNPWGVALQNLQETTLVANGDQRAPMDEAGWYDWGSTIRYLEDGTLEGSVAEAGFNDVIKGWGFGERISGFGGNDALSGGGGNDLLLGGDGDDLLAGGFGSDEIHGDAGNDYISTTHLITAPAKQREDQTWSPPEKGEIFIAGSTWGVYTPEGSQHHIIRGIEQDAVKDAAEDVAYGGDGNDVILASLGSDLLYGDAGDDVIWGMGAGDVMYGGDGMDRMRGDGDSEANLFQTLDLALHGDDYMDGGRGDDVLLGHGGNDTLYGGADNDTLWGDDINEEVLPATSHGNDYLNGGDGDDYVVGAGKDDTLIGGAGNDDLVGDQQESELAGQYHGSDYLEGGEGEDQLIGAGKNDTLIGGAGNDSLWGDMDEASLSAAHHGNDTLDGGDGDDYLAGGGKGDALQGGTGADTLLGDDAVDKLAGAEHGDDSLIGHDGADILVGGGGSDQLLGGNDNDQLSGDDPTTALAGTFHGKDTLDGGAGDDLLNGNGQDDVLVGGTGNDQLEGDGKGDVLQGNFHGSDTLDGGEGDDTMYGDGGADTIYGGAGTDLIQADRDGSALAVEFHGNDYVDGGVGNDQISGGGGNDVLLGGEGDDWLAGEDEVNFDDVSKLTGNDRLDGGAGSDTLVGGNGDDVLAGGDGDDWLYGGAGADTLDGGAGSNVLKGGDGDDTYICNGEGTYIISDTSGNNVVIGADGLAASVNTEGALILSSADKTVVLTDAMAGGFAGLIQVGSSNVSLSEYIAENIHDPLNLVGTHPNSTVQGGTAADEIVANGHASVIGGGKGNDKLTINALGTTVALNRGDGADNITISQAPAANMPASDKLTLRFGPGIKPSDISIEYVSEQNALQVRYSSEPGDMLIIHYAESINASIIQHLPVGQIQFSDGSSMPFRYEAKEAIEKVDFNYQIPASIFEPLSGPLAYTASLADGKALPAWLQFDSQKGTFSGKPENDDVGNIKVLVTAKDNQNATSSYQFNLSIRNVNDAPIAGAPLAAQKYRESDAWSFDLPVGTFSDIDKNDLLTYSARLADGKALPNWLTIDKDTGQLTHTPDYALGTQLSLIITATDKAGATAEQKLDIKVESEYAYFTSTTTIGTPGNDTLIGSNTNDVLIGGWGDDILDGGAGDDELIGGNGSQETSSYNSSYEDEGSDTYLFGRGDGKDYISEGAAWDRHGWGIGQGTNILQFKSGIGINDIQVSRAGPEYYADGNEYLPSCITLTIKDTGESITIDRFNRLNARGPGALDMVTFKDHPEIQWDYDEVKRRSLIGDDKNNEIYGYVGIDILIGNDGDDELRAQNGDDQLTGGRGNDRLYGRWGADTYLFGRNDGSDNIYEPEYEGVDRIKFTDEVLSSQVTFTKALNNSEQGSLVIRVNGGNTEIWDNFFFDGVNDAGIESIEFTDGIVWNRAQIVAQIQGSEGSVDTFTGTLNDDSYTVDNTNDSIIEELNGGKDSVSSSVSYTLSTNVENLTLTGSRPINGTGNTLTNTIIGNSADNILDSGSGGQDTLQGGAGNDIYRILAPFVYHYYWRDTPEVLDFNILEGVHEGIDELQTNNYYMQLPDNVENLRISSFRSQSIKSPPSLEPFFAKYIGNALDNTLDVSAVSSDFIPIELDGGEGNDLLIGSYALHDMASYQSARAGVNVSLAITAAQDTGAAGIDTLLRIEGLRGSRFNDTLQGDIKDNWFFGGGGVNYIAGGKGNDTYYVDGLDDTLVELADEGNDTIVIKGLLCYTLGENMENMIAELPSMSDAEIDAILTGNIGNNHIKLNSAPFINKVSMKGLDGDDVLENNSSSTTIYELDGGNGDDRLIGKSGEYIFTGGQGSDTYVTSLFSNTNGVIKSDAGSGNAQDINQLRLSGASIEQLNFRRENNALIINQGKNRLLIEDFFAGESASAGNPLQKLVLDDGTTLTYSQIVACVKENEALVAQKPLGTMQLTSLARGSSNAQDEKKISPDSYFEIPPALYINNDLNVKDGSSIINIYHSLAAANISNGSVKPLKFEDKWLGNTKPLANQVHEWMHQGDLKPLKSPLAALGHTKPLYMGEDFYSGVMKPLALNEVALSGYTKPLPDQGTQWTFWGNLKPFAIETEWQGNTKPLSLDDIPWYGDTKPLLDQEADTLFSGHLKPFGLDITSSGLDNHAQQLIDAMAGFAPAAAGQTTVLTQAKPELVTLLACDWYR